MDNLSSDDILKQINDVTNELDEGGEEQSVSEITAGWVKNNVSEGEPEYEEPSTDSYESEEQLMQQYREQGTKWVKDQIDKTGRMPQAGEYPSFDQWKNNRDFFQPHGSPGEFAAAFREDIEDLTLRYGDLCNGFLRKLRRGEIDIPEEYETLPNPLEALFINTIDEATFRKLDTEAQRRFIESANQPPLRTTSYDVVIPARKKPVAKPRPKQQTYKLPELTQADVNEMMSDFIKKHPQRFGR